MHVEHTDALGNPVVTGATYGYTISSSGVTDVVVGKVDKQGEVRVTLLVAYRARCVYGGKYEPKPEAIGTKVTVYSCNLFPVQT